MNKNRRRLKKHLKLHYIMSILFSAVIISIIFMKVSPVDAHADVPERYKYYTSVYVDRDDTLWDISKEYISEEYPDARDYIDEVVSINHLDSDELQYGTTICVPYYSDELK